ncbi:MAG: hypothetical protein ACM65L_12370 [Microcoleus sp.]
MGSFTISGLTPHHHRLGNGLTERATQRSRLPPRGDCRYIHTIYGHWA